MLTPRKVFSWPCRPTSRSRLWHSVMSVYRLSVLCNVCRLLYCGKTVRLSEKLSEEAMAYMGNRMVTWTTTSRDPERSRSWLQ